MYRNPLKKYSDTQKFVQNIDQHLLESITNSQKNSVLHEGFDSIIRFLNASAFYGLLTPRTNFDVWLYDRINDVVCGLVNQRLLWLTEQAA